MGLLRSPSRQLDRDIYRAHQAWIKAGGKGPGRLVAEDEVLRRMSATALRLQGAQFKRCDMKKADLNNTNLESALLENCDLSEANLYMVTLASAVVDGCRFFEAKLALATIENTQLTGCDLGGASAARLLFKGASVGECNFQGALLLDAETKGTRFTDCNFRNSTIARKIGGPNLGTTSQSRFENCDFRGTDFTGRKIDRTTFVSCLFHGAVGAPELGEDVTVLGADLSADGDGSDIVDPMAFLERWKSEALSSLH